MYVCVYKCVPRENRGSVVMALSDAAVCVSDVFIQRNEMIDEKKADEAEGKDKNDEEIVEKKSEFFSE